MIYERIKYFIKTAECGSFSKAAKELYISPQALTKQMSVLEDELGGKLFARTVKGIALTELGELAYAKLNVAAATYDQTIDQVKDLFNNAKPKINIGLYTALPQESMIAPLLTFMLAKYSEYQLGIQLIELSEGREKLLNGTLDLLLTNTHEEDRWDECEKYAYSSTEARVAVSLVHPWAVKDEVTIEDLKSETFLKMDMDESKYTVPREDSFYENIPCKKIKRVNNFSTLMALLGQGAGFAVIPLVFANLKQARIKDFSFPERSFKFYTALVYNKKNESKMLDRIVKEIVEEFDLKSI